MQSSPQHTKGLGQSGFLPSSTSEDYFLKVAFELKNSVVPPLQSLFRVFALLNFVDGETPKGMVGYVTGTNCECCFLSNNICAERSALAQLRWKKDCYVRKVFIVSDSMEFITPGMLCREFMFNHYCDENTSIITCGENKVGRTFSLGSLFPFPSVYLNVDRDSLLIFGKHFQSRCEAVTVYFQATSKPAGWGQLYQEMVQCCTLLDQPFPETSKSTPPSLSTTHSLHPIAYSAGVLYKNGDSLVIPHHVGIEYGCALDAVSRLTPFLETQRQKGNLPEVLLQTDQFGTLHAPCSVARAYLFERGFGDLKTVVHGPSPSITNQRRHQQDTKVHLHEVFIKDLAPHSPSVVELFRKAKI